MRRMMHAAAFLLLNASFAQAQYKVNLLQAIPDSDHSVSTIRSDAVEITDSAAMRASTSQSMVAPTFIPFGSDRPYSQLSLYMNCNDCSPNLWNNYSSERAAIAACISRHVDGKCSCFDHKHCLHAQAASPCGDQGCGAGCPKGNGHKLNRYRQPMSSLYCQSSSNCGSPCLSTFGNNYLFGDSSQLRDRVAAQDLGMQRDAALAPISTRPFDARR